MDIKQKIKDKKKKQKKMQVVGGSKVGGVSAAPQTQNARPPY